MKLTLNDVRVYLQKLDKIASSNEWLPSPFEIELYFDFVVKMQYNNGELIDDNELLNELLELEDRLDEHYVNAYEQ